MSLQQTNEFHGQVSYLVAIFIVAKFFEAQAVEHETNTIVYYLADPHFRPALSKILGCGVAAQ